MPNPFGGTNIVGCNSPALGPDKDRFAAVIDTLAESLDGHDHSSGKGIQIPTGGITDGAITVDKIDDLQVTEDKIEDDAVITTKIGTGGVTARKRSATNRVFSNYQSTIDLTGINSSVQTFPYSATIIASGTKPIRVEFCQGQEGSEFVTENPDSGGQLSAFTGSNVTVALLAELQLFRDGAIICSAGFGSNNTSGLYFTPTSFCFTDTDTTPGSRVYEIKVESPPGVGAANTLNVLTIDMKIIAYEM